MPKNSMATSLSNLEPAILVEFFDHLSHLHNDSTVAKTSQNLETSAKHFCLEILVRTSELRESFASEAKLRPFVQRVGTEGTIEVDRRLIPVEY